MLHIISWVIKWTFSFLVTVSFPRSMCRAFWHYITNLFYLGNIYKTIHCKLCGGTIDWVCLNMVMTLCCRFLNTYECTTYINLCTSVCVLNTYIGYIWVPLCMLICLHVHLFSSVHIGLVYYPFSCEIYPSSFIYLS